MTIELDSFRGCIYVAHKGVELYKQASGYRDLSNRVKNNIKTRFGTASAGKAFVGVAILQLIEQEKLSLEDTIGNILDFDLKQIDPMITIRQLLTHTSGVPSYFDEEKVESYSDLWKDYPNYKVRTNRDLIPLFIDLPMRYPRGTKFEYSDTAFVILGIIIEIITKKPFDVYMEKAVFKPAKMRHTGYYPMDALPKNCANHYIYDKEKKSYHTNIYSIDAKGSGAGGAYTTLSDIHSFWMHLFKGTLLSKEMLKDMLSNQSGEAECYGYAMWLKKIEDRFVPYFEGFDPGATFISMYDEKEDFMSIIMSNYQDDVWDIQILLNRLVYTNY